MSTMLDDLRMYARLPRALRRIFRAPMTPQEAKETIRRRMANRSELFVSGIERNIFANSSSPYLPLLKRAGCEAGDLRECVRQAGIEQTLTRLRAEGVYLTFEEFKGRADVTRNGLSYRVTPAALNNPHLTSFISIESGGSTGRPTASAVDVDHLLGTTPMHWLRAEAYNLTDAPEVLWQGILPASTLTTLIHRARMGMMPVRWFSSIGLRDSRHWVKYDLATYYTLGWMRLLGARVPFPEYRSLGEAGLVARSIYALAREHGKCRVNMNVSRALRVSLFAQEQGWDMGGVSFVSGGEPCTPVKVEAIEKCGARF
jgi:hypothetical protein